MKTWKRPELIVLVRGKPEERVLAGCKSVDSGTAPETYYGGCSSEATGASSCSECAQLSNS